VGDAEARAFHHALCGLAEATSPIGALDVAIAALENVVASVEPPRPHWPDVHGGRADV
jgi:hypothetical protein